MHIHAHRFWIELKDSIFSLFCLDGGGGGGGGTM